MKRDTENLKRTAMTAQAAGMQTGIRQALTGAQTRTGTGELTPVRQPAAQSQNVRTAAGAGPKAQQSPADGPAADHKASCPDPDGGERVRICTVPGGHECLELSPGAAEGTPGVLSEPV